MPVEVTNSIGLQLMLMSPGEFMMGSPASEELRDDDETQHRVHPVEMASWEDAVEYCRKLSELPAERRAGRVYRLPTEAEWEYACRAGTTTRYYFGDDASMLGDYVWYTSNSGSKTHPVGQKKANAWGLYDMHGDVWEWCSNWYGNYASTTVSDPTGPATGSRRVNRGGSWAYDAGRCRSAYRAGLTPAFRSLYLGFRLAASSVDPAEACATGFCEEPFD